MARKKKHEEHENHERWLVSYADFITLLFAFFVVMYSLSAVNEGKFRVLSEALVAAFRSMPKSAEPVQFGQPNKPELVNNSMLKRAPEPSAFSGTGISLPPKPVDDPVKSGARSISGSKEQGQRQAMQEIAQRVEQAMAQLIEKDLITVRRFRYWIEVEIKTNILFSSGSALLDRGALPVLKEIAQVLRDYPNRVQVEGHTDGLPIRNAVYPSNWELSAARAMSVVHMLSRDDISPSRLSAVGYGEYRPVAENDGEGGRMRNRRVVLVVLSEEDNVQRLRDLQGEKEPEVSAQGDPTEEVPRQASTVAPESAAATPSASSATATKEGAAGGSPVAPSRIDLPPVMAPPVAIPQPVAPGAPARGG